MDTASLNKLKVAELQQLLRERGLPASGNKADLVQVKYSTRSCCFLLMHFPRLDLSPSTLLDKCSLIGIHTIDLEVQLKSSSSHRYLCNVFFYFYEQRLVKAKEEETPANGSEATASSAAKPADDAAQAESNSNKAGSAAAAAVTADPESSHKKDSTEEKGATSSAPPANKTEAKADSTGTENGNDNDEGGVNLLDLGEEERRKHRAAKFGLPDDAAEVERRKARAAKFGLPDEDAEEQKRKARAAKFGLPDDSAEEDRKKARAAKFGIVEDAVQHRPVSMPSQLVFVRISFQPPLLIARQPPPFISLRALSAVRHAGERTCCSVAKNTDTKSDTSPSNRLISGVRCALRATQS